MFKRTPLHEFYPGSVQLVKLLSRLSTYLEDERTLQQKSPKQKQLPVRKLTWKLAGRSILWHTDVLKIIIQLWYVAYNWSLC